MTVDTFKKRLGQRLLRLRDNADLSRADVADKAGITRQHLHRLESGTTNPKLETLFALGKVYRKTIAELVSV